MNDAEGKAYAAFYGVNALEPRPFPMQALDHAAGYFLALGINIALGKTISVSRIRYLRIPC